MCQIMRYITAHDACDATVLPNNISNKAYEISIQLNRSDVEMLADVIHCATPQLTFTPAQLREYLVNPD